jgi:hypothetical protein
VLVVLSVKFDCSNHILGDKRRRPFESLLSTKYESHDVLQIYGSPRPVYRDSFTFLIICLLPSVFLFYLLPTLLSFFFLLFFHLLPQVITSHSSPLLLTFIRFVASSFFVFSHLPLPIPFICSFYRHPSPFSNNRRR